MARAMTEAERDDVRAIHRKAGVPSWEDGLCKSVDEAVSNAVRYGSMTPEERALEFKYTEQKTAEIRRERKAKMPPPDPRDPLYGYTVTDASGANDDAVGAPSPRVITMSTVVREHITWTWRGRIARALINLLDGDPGVGKSTITIDLAARITTGEPMPLETDRRPPSDVLLIGAEDHLAATVLPRLVAAGADLARVHVVEAVPRLGDPDAPPTLADVAAIERIVVERKITLVVIDPLMAHLPSGTDAHRDSDMRAVLSPWAAMAQRTGAAILIVRHLRKMGGPAIYRGSSSIGIIGAARSALLVGRDPDDPETCVLAHAKGNLAPPPPSLRYRVIDSDGVGRIEWIGTTDCDADRLAALPDQHRSDDADPVDKACAALRELLTDRWAPKPDVHNDVRAMTGASERTIERARSKLGVIHRKSGKVWLLSLPGGVDRGGHESPPNTPTPPAQFRGGVDAQSKPNQEHTHRNSTPPLAVGAVADLTGGGHEFGISATSATCGESVADLTAVQPSMWSRGLLADARRAASLHASDGDDE